MKKSGTTFLKAVLVLMATIALTGLLWFPQTEGRATNLDLVSIYTDPLIIYIYIASLPFFATLYQSFKLLGYMEKNKAFSQISVNTLRNIKYYALTLSGLIAAAMSYIALTSKEDDPAGAIAMSIVIIFASIVIATAAAVFQKLLQNAVDIKSENDLTV
jgi:cytochrome bd-type quinol oxidase subunit 2